MKRIHWRDLLRPLYGGIFWASRQSALRIILVVGAVLFAVVSLLVSDRLVRLMGQEERRKMEIWAAATQAVASNDYEQSLYFASRILESNTTIPMILVDGQGRILSYNNIELPRRNPEKYLYQKLAEFRAGYPPIKIENITTEYLYYSDSSTLQQLLLFPYVQVAVFLVILGISLLAITSMKRADQNHIWEGMSRETAHQLGTPISSLIAWRELLALQGVDPSVLSEMGKDIERLEVIADRFQKVGSAPKLLPVDLGELLHKSVDYLRPRISQQVQIAIIDEPNEAVIVPLSEALIAWVFENLVKNAVDAMQGKGDITIRYRQRGKEVYIDLQDTGRGMPLSQYEAIFRPGYTTRQRGWGLGLSLARRIVEDYHHGRIYVRESREGQGTTFRIELSTEP
ncbi:MAG: HAMP domain-containing sensor histidine kinase [Porphyromonas sp.]|nr:HAMP domain-containing sensor histidine kinase [Porphyromonas sp.]